MSMADPISIPMRRLGLLAFADELGTLHREHPDTSFCWILGAGASIKSGIPAAGVLAEKWFRELFFQETDKKDGWEKWLQTGCGIPNVQPCEPTGENFARCYSAIYEARFSRMPSLGQRELERHIDAAQPSYGYYVLAEILTGSDPAQPSRHNIVITSNFDNLVADSLSALGKRAAIVIGHHALAEFASPTRRRPLILKFHHDYLYNPLSVTKDLAHMQTGYKRPLDDIFRRYTPVVIGYGGNDPSLMDLLAKLPEASMPGGMYWCVRRGSPPAPAVLEILRRQLGTLVEIPGFDELFALLENEFRVNFQPEQLQARVDHRVQQLRDAKAELQRANEAFFTSSADKRADPAGKSEAGAVLSALAEPAPPLAPNAPAPPAATVRKWWEWEELASSKSDPAEKDRVYREALAATGDAAPLLGNYAIFLTDVRKDHDAAEKYYLQAIAADPGNSYNLGNYALFLNNVRNNPEEAEKFYLRALEAAPGNPDFMGNYAIFLAENRGEYDKAETYFLRALQADPTDADRLGNHGVFLERMRKNYDAAETTYLRALEAAPNHANNLGNYALFLENIRKDNDGAEKYYRRALAADPNHANHLGNYALFLENVRQDNEAAEKYFLRALEADPNHVNNLSNYALFLKRVRQDFDGAEKYYLRALAIDPENAEVVASYAQLMDDLSKQ